MKERPVCRAKKGGLNIFLYGDMHAELRMGGGGRFVTAGIRYLGIKSTGAQNHRVVYKPTSTLNKKPTVYLKALTI